MTAALILLGLAAAAAAYFLGRRPLLEEKRRLEGVLAGASDGLLLCDLTGQVLYQNAEAGRLLGEGPDCRMRVQRVLERRDEGEVLELIRPDGGKSWCRAEVSVLEPGASPPKVLLTLRDGAAEHQKQDVREGLFRAAADDLRAPVFAMQGYLRLLEKSLTPDKHQKGYLDALTRSCDALVALVQDAVDAARMEAKQLPLRAVPVDAEAVIKRLGEECRALADEKGARVEVSLAEDRPKYVDADEKLLGRALRNLLWRALNSSRRGAVIELFLSSSGRDHADLGVIERAQGKDERDPGQAMEPGWVFCRDVAALHGGTLRLESPAGAGRRFILRMPIRQG